MTAEAAEHLMPGGQALTEAHKKKRAPAAEGHDAAVAAPADGGAAAAGAAADGGATGPAVGGAL